MSRLPEISPRRNNLDQHAAAHGEAGGGRGGHRRRRSGGTSSMSMTHTATGSFPVFLTTMKEIPLIVTEEDAAAANRDAAWTQQREYQHFRQKKTLVKQVTARLQGGSWDTDAHPKDGPLVWLVKTPTIQPSEEKMAPMKSMLSGASYAFSPVTSMAPPPLPPEQQDGESPRGRRHGHYTELFQTLERTTDYRRRGLGRKQSQTPRRTTTLAASSSGKSLEPLVTDDAGDHDELPSITVSAPAHATEGAESCTDPQLAAAAAAAVAAACGPAAPPDAEQECAAAEGDEQAWDSVLETISPKQKLPPARREAAFAMRYFVFHDFRHQTNIPNEQLEKAIFETVGTKDEVLTLLRLWRRMDADRSGRVSLIEFREYSDKRIHELRMEKKQSERDPQKRNAISEEHIMNLSKVADKLGKVLFGKKSSFAIEDLMQIIWPCATIAEVKQMKVMCNQLKDSARRRVTTPPVLSTSEFEGLCSVFKFFDTDDSNSISVVELVQGGLLDFDQATEYVKEWDKDMNGVLSMLEFCEMMCPPGFRAHVAATRATDEDGSALHYDVKYKGWRRLEAQSEQTQPLQPTHLT